MNVGCAQIEIVTPVMTMMIMQGMIMTMTGVIMMFGRVPVIMAMSMVMPMIVPVISTEQPGAGEIDCKTQGSDDNRLVIGDRHRMQ